MPPLPVPEAGALDDATEVPAMTLFAQRAQAVRPAFSIAAANRDAVGELCRRLDGLPLAIELAAARVTVLTPAAMVARLSDRFTVLAGGPRDAPARLRSMRDTIGWSYDLLSAEEQRLFRCLSVFVGGFSLDAVEAVWTRTGDASPDTLTGITSLVDKSLVQPVDVVAGAPRFAMLETIREYGQERLVASGEEAAVRDRHATWCVSLKDDIPSLFDPTRQISSVDRVEAEHANIRVALAWLESSQRTLDLATLVIALRWHWQLAGHQTEGLTWYKRLIADRSVLDPLVSCDALRLAGLLAQVLGDPSAQTYLEDA